MACFKLIYQNHWNFGIHVADTILMIKYALEAEGHRADIEKDIVPGYTNIVLENFDDAFVTAARSAYDRDQSTDFIVIATEFLTGNTFNNFESSNNGDVNESNNHYKKTHYWLERFQKFRELLPLTKAIWHLSSAEVEVYQKALNREDVFYLPHLYSPYFRSVKHRPDHEKDIDFLFTGTLTDYRQQVLDQLIQAGYRVEVSPMLTASFHRNDLIARSKVALNLRQSAQWQHPSVSRLFYHISNASLVLSEVCEYQSDLDSYVDFAKVGGDFLSLCQEIICRGKFNELGEMRLRSFSSCSAQREEFSVALKKTLAQQQ